MDRGGYIFIHISILWEDDFARCWIHRISRQRPAQNTLFEGHDDVCTFHNGAQFNPETCPAIFFGDDAILCNVHQTAG